MSVQEPNRIDFISCEPTGGYWLNMTEERGWSEVGEDFVELKAKVNTYIGYVVSGLFQEDIADFQGHPVGLRVICAEEPTAAARHMLSLFKAACAHHDLGFSVLVLEGESGREVEIPMGKISKR